MSDLRDQNVVVVGGSRGVGREIVHRVAAQGARILSVARGREGLEELTKELPGVAILALDATLEEAPSSVFAMMRPDILIICAGAIPPAKPLQDLSWDQFATNWTNDVKMSFLFCRYALQKPLKPGSLVALISSGAGLGGSPISGGYAGAKRMQMLMANYCQKESERLDLGMRFVAVVPMRIMPETKLGSAAVKGYSQYLGISAEDFIAGMANRQSTADVADAIVSIRTQSIGGKDTVFGVSALGLAPLALA